MPRWPRRSCVLALVLGLAFAGELALTPACASAQRQHTVRAGQSLSRIARSYRVSAWDLALANRMRPEHVLRPGMVLAVPPEGVTYVQPRQTLSDIAREHDCETAELVRLNRLRAGSVRLRIGQRLILPGYQEVAEAGETDLDRDWGAPTEPGLVRIRRNGELAAVRLLDAEGRVTAEGLTRLGELMRRREEDAAALPHPRLARLIAAISDHFGGRQITLVSGRRGAGGNTRETSRHVSGQATDIRVDGISHRALWTYCRSLAQTGCGYYPRSTFVHVDVREQAAQWVDWSQPGRRPVYGNLRAPWGRACRRLRPGVAPPRACAREGRSVTRAGVVPVETLLTDEARALVPIVPALAAGEEPDEEGDGES